MSFIKAWLHRLIVFTIKLAANQMYQMPINPNLFHSNHKVCDFNSSEGEDPVRSFLTKSHFSMTFPR